MPSWTIGIAIRLGFILLLAIFSGSFITYNHLPNNHPPRKVDISVTNPQLSDKTSC
ncbi:hypothetical protein H6F78_15285 [Coleofasciculus sp. FACHB-64]|uniref:hypothetical protein n=1 Tax=Trichocoleus sp. AS-A2 TaxID=2933922 RepID=UPI0019CA7DDC|nr:hypothetical protein [Coleofasciculus sp. FACHB-64]